MKKSTKRVLAMVLAAVMLLALAACGGGGGDTAQQPPADSGGGSNAAEPAAPSGSKELTVYTAFPEAEVVYYFNEFEKETGIKVNYIRLSAGEMLTRVEAEKENPQATLMFGGSTDNYIAAVEKGLLEPYQSSELGNTPPPISIPPAPGTRSMWAASPSPATRSGLPTRACPIPAAGRTCWTPPIRARSLWHTPLPPAPHTPFWPPWSSSRVTTGSGSTWAS